MQTARASPACVVRRRGGERTGGYEPGKVAGRDEAWRREAEVGHEPALGGREVGHGEVQGGDKLEAGEAGSRSRRGTGSRGGARSRS